MKGSSAVQGGSCKNKKTVAEKQRHATKNRSDCFDDDPFWDSFDDLSPDGRAFRFSDSESDNESYQLSQAMDDPCEWGSSKSKEDEKKRSDCAVKANRNKIKEASKSTMKVKPVKKKAVVAAATDDTDAMVWVEGTGCQKWMHVKWPEDRQRRPAYSDNELEDELIGRSICHVNDYLALGKADKARQTIAALVGSEHLEAAHEKGLRRIEQIFDSLLAKTAMMEALPFIVIAFAPEGDSSVVNSTESNCDTNSEL